MIKIGEALKVGWGKFMERPWYLMGISLAMMGFFMATAGNAVFTALSYIAFGGYLSMLLMHYDGKRIVFDDFFSLDNRWIYFVFASMIKGFLVMLGLLLLIIPGIYLAMRFYFVELLVIDKGLRPMEAIRESSKMTEGKKWKLLGFSIIITLLLLLSVLLLIVGLLPASIIVSLAIIHIYRRLSEFPATPESESVNTEPARADQNSV